MSAGAAPADVRAFLAARHPEAAEVALWVRDVVLRAEQDFIGRVYPGWDGIGFRHPDAGYVCAIYPRGGEVRLLFEHCARLDAPDALLEGDRRQTRHVTIRAPDQQLAGRLARLVHDAVAQRLFGR